MSEHIVYPRVYIMIFLALLAGTGLTAYVAYFNFPGPLNAVMAMTIAVIKATLVVLFFMHVRYSPRLVALVIAAALFWMAILFALTISDYSTRAWLPVM
jgi:cytochrome c oxidase subunit IV